MEALVKQTELLKKITKKKRFTLFLLAPRAENFLNLLTDYEYWNSVKRKMAFLQVA